MPAAPEIAAELRCALDPVVFAIERLGFKPDPWQADVLRLSHQNTLLNCSRQAGKSTTTAIIALHTALYRPGSLVLLAASSAVTGLVSLESLVAAMEQALPPYRREHCAANARALAAGHRALPAGAASAWQVAA